MCDAIGYKMTHDTGFAPNPFHGYLTLATCKPRVRAARKVGEWIAGFASKQLVERARREGVAIPYMGLIYLARVDEVIALHKYFEDARFREKRPTFEQGSLIERAGDNIYYLDDTGNYRQLRNHSHGEHLADLDTGGKNALVAREFYYFGRNCFTPPEGWSTFLGGPLSTGRTFNCRPGFAEKLLSRFQEGGIQPGIIGQPCGLEARPDSVDPAYKNSCSPNQRTTPALATQRRSAASSC